MLFIKNKFVVVGRGVLRFWSARYRKPRSNLGLFSKIHADSVSGGVDIIYLGGGYWRAVCRVDMIIGWFGNCYIFLYVRYGALKYCGAGRFMRCFGYLCYLGLF